MHLSEMNPITFSDPPEQLYVKTKTALAGLCTSKTSVMMGGDGKNKLKMT